MGILGGWCSFAEKTIEWRSTEVYRREQKVA
jgi:hypothetical protein